MAIDDPSPHNPYAAPTTEFIDGPEPEVYDLRLFVRWEKLRLIYNTILGVESLFFILVLTPKNPPWIILGTLTLYALAANACFCLGPVLNGYALLIGLKRKFMTWIIFGLGVILSILLVPAVILTLGVDILPNQK